MIPQSLRFRVSIFYSSVLCLILVFFSTFLYLTVQRILLRDFDSDQQFKAQEVATFLNVYEEINLPEAHPYVILSPKGLFLQSPDFISEKEKAFLLSLWKNEFKTLNLQKDLLRVIDNKGRVLVQSQNLDAETGRRLDSELHLIPPETLFKTLLLQNQPMRIVSLPFSYKEQQNPAHFVQIASSLKSQQAFLKEFLFFIILSIIFILAVTSFMGRSLTRRVLLPVEQITSTAKRISHEDLNIRLPDQSRDIEMRYLVAAFNEMLQRLENSFRHINEFSSHVAHELKTPLAVMRGEIELALKGPSSLPEYQRVLEVCLPEVDRLIHIIRDLLLLAKLEFSSGIFHFEELDLVALIRELSEHAQILGDEKQIRVTSQIPESPLSIPGDKVHLRRLFLNITQNAITHTPEAGTITITLSKIDQNAYIAIRDTGKGIAPEHLDKIFDKFYRITPPKDSHDFGVGLGLSMAMAIAKAHRGDIKVQSQLSIGSTFTVILPLQ
jgi:two-component system, OmpR family, heavy metal sensor histidine kinase CusS